MNSKITATVNRFPPILWQVICFAASIGIFSLILLNRSPNFLRPLSMALRTGFGLVIPATAILVYLAFRLPGRSGELASLIVSMSLFALPLAGLWASGQTQTTVLSGIIPLVDAGSYYIDALGLINGSKFSIFSARRPLFPGFLAVLLSITNHNLMASLAILTAITGIACYFMAKEIQRTHGAEAAVFVLIILFLFYRIHSGTSMTENLGVTLGALGFSLLWRGTSNRDMVYIWAGLATTTLALNARSGAFFILPMLIIWFGWIFRKNNWISWKVILITASAVIFGFTLNLVVTKIITVPSGVPFANFSYTLFGLASGGKSWVYIFEVHPEVLHLQEPEQSKMIYRLAFEAIKQNPLLILQGAFFNWKMLFSNSWYNVYAYVGGENWTINVVARWVMYILCITGIYSWFQNRSDPLAGLVMVSALGIFMSAPFLPPTDAYRMRPYAASIVILAALPAMGLAYLLKKSNVWLFNKTMQELNPSTLPLQYSAILTLLLVLGPIVVYLFAKPVHLQSASCPAGSESILVRLDEGNYVIIRKQNTEFLDWMPNYHIGLFKDNSHSLAVQKTIEWAESVEPTSTIFLTLDLKNNQKALVVIKSETPPTFMGYAQLCGTFENDPSLSSLRIFNTTEVLPLSP